jgi:hypothetical protein
MGTSFSSHRFSPEQFAHLEGKHLSSSSLCPTYGVQLSVLCRGTKIKIAASCFSIYAYEALKKELGKIDNLDFIFTAPTFVPEGATDKFRKERREFFIPKAQRERSLYGSEFEIQLRNKLTQRAIARECAAWIRRKANFRSNRTKAPMQPFICAVNGSEQTVYMPVNGFTAVDFGIQKGDAVSNIVNRFDGAPHTNTYLELFDQIWADPEKLEDVTEAICRHIESVYSENSPERIYFLILYNLFSEFLEEIDEDVLPNDRTGYLDSVVWNKLFNFQRDAATGIINKLETFRGGHRKYVQKESLRPIELNDVEWWTPPIGQ